MKNQKNTGYPSIDQTHLRDTTFWERHPFVPSISISGAIDFVSRGHWDTPVIEQRRLTVARGEYIADAKMVAKALRQLGVCRGDIITIATPNLYQGLVIFKAANRIGAVVTFVNEKASDQELLHYLKLYDSPLLVTYDKDSNYASQIIKKSPVDFVINISAEYVDSRMQTPTDEQYFYYIEYHNLISPASE